MLSCIRVHVRLAGRRGGGVDQGGAIGGEKDPREIEPEGEPRRITGLDPERRQKCQLLDPGQVGCGDEVAPVARLAEHTLRPGAGL